MDPALLDQPHASLTTYLDATRGAPIKGPIALIMAEDEVEIASTLRHHLRLGFRQVLLLAVPELELDPALSDELGPAVIRIHHDVHAEAALPRATTRLAEARPGAWIYAGYNAEYLHFPFCETRTVREMLAFHAEERREAMLCYVIDLYAPDLQRHPGAVSLEDAHLDRTGYYALPRKDAARDWAEKERQMDFFGGLRWRFEEHIPWTRRKIDRIALFRARPGLEMAADFTLNEDELNTYACPWHHNLTAAVCSFRTAKALRRNPGSRDEISSFMWHNSVPFSWSSQQLMEMGLMEPGQWF